MNDLLLVNSLIGLGLTTQSSFCQLAIDPAARQNYTFLVTDPTLQKIVLDIHVYDDCTSITATFQNGAIYHIGASHDDWTLTDNHDALDSVHAVACDDPAQFVYDLLNTGDWTPPDDWSPPTDD